jgi:drug/metabolite transporter (DMT)-like permease
LPEDLKRRRPPPEIPMLKPPENREVLRGIVLLLLSASLFGAVDGFSKLLADTQSVGQIVWARYVLAIPVLLASLPPSEWTRTFHTERPWLQIARGITPLTVSAGMVLGVRYLPLAEATAILFAAPFLIAALSMPYLGERIRPASWIGIVVGFIAVLIVARPGFSELSRYTAFPALAAVFYAFLQLITRRLGALGEKPTTTLAWTLLVGGVASTPLAIANWEPVSPTAWLYMIALGVVFGASQLTLIRAFTYAPAGVLAPFNYFQIVSAVIFGLIVFGDVPDLWTLVGITLIIGAGVYVAKSRTG